jgi:hypothetical protein
MLPQHRPVLPGGGRIDDAIRKAASAIIFDAS